MNLENSNPSFLRIGDSYIQASAIVSMEPGTVEIPRWEPGMPENSFGWVFTLVGGRKMNVTDREFNLVLMQLKHLNIFVGQPNE